MKISTEKPPIYDRAEKAFGTGLWDKGTIFTYGDTVHVKKGGMSLDLHAHEQVHIDRQAVYPGGASAWWDRYLTDKKFRLDEEVEAYRAQAAYIRGHMVNRVKRQQAIAWIHSCMADMYGDMITLKEAQQLV